MLEKTEGTIGNEQYSDTGNIEHSTKRKKPKKKTQQKTPQKYTQKTKMMSKTDPPEPCG